MRRGRKRWVGQVDEHTLPVAKRSDPHQGPDGFDVATGFADESADVLVGQLDFDRHRSAAALERLDQHFLWLLGQPLGHVLDQRAVVDSRSAWRRPVAPETAAAAIETAAPKVTPRGSASLLVAQGFPPASTGCAPPRSEERRVGKACSFRWP